jgi:D-threo-aldose 1-dehydrogenase
MDIAPIPARASLGAMTDPIPTRLGFGVSGALGTPLIAADKVCALIHAAFEAGLVHFDTAPAYGAGEDLPRDALHLSTKAGILSRGLARRQRDFTPDAIEASLCASLLRLGVEGVDTLFLHGAAVQEWTPDLRRRLDDLRAAGAFVRLGAAGRGAELDAALDAGARAIMCPVHPFMDDAAKTRLARARSGGCAVFAIETSGPGRSPVTPPRRVTDLYRLAKSLRALAGPGAPSRLRVPVAEGLRHALDHPDVDIALMTTTRLDHLAGNLALSRA